MSSSIRQSVATDQIDFIFLYAKLANRLTDYEGVVIMNKERKDLFKKYEASFPSDTFLQEFVRNKQELLEVMFATKSALLQQKGWVHLFDDVSLHEALDSGLLIAAANQDDVFQYDKRVFMQHEDVYFSIRENFDSILRVQAMRQMRRQIDYGGQSNQTIPVVFVFKDCKYSDLILGNLDNSLPYDSRAESMLCHELITQYKTGAFHSDPWWQWNANEKSIWIEPIQAKLQAEILRFKQTRKQDNNSNYKLLEFSAK